MNEDTVIKHYDRLIDYEDTNGTGRLHEMNIPCFIATRAVKR